MDDGVPFDVACNKVGIDWFAAKVVELGGVLILDGKAGLDVRLDGVVA